jgi:hypothetical protein
MVNSALAEPGEIAQLGRALPEPIAKGRFEITGFRALDSKAGGAIFAKRRGETSISRAHHRSSVGPSFAPKVAQMPIGRPYQSAMDGSDPSTQGNVQAKAPKPPATRPAISPACV